MAMVRGNKKRCCVRCWNAACTGGTLDEFTHPPSKNYGKLKNSWVEELRVGRNTIAVHGFSP
jgi:hypothetical protein